MASGTWRFDTTVYKNKTTSDPAQVPAAATINFYRQGAFVSQAVSIPVTINDPEPQPTVVSVYDSGTLALSDILHVNGDSSVRLSVGEVSGGTSLSLLNLTQNEITLMLGDRLITTSAPRPTAYRDPTASVPLGSAISSDSVTGRGGCYLTESVVDYVVTGSGLSARAFADVEGGTSVGWINARRFSSIQAAIDALPAAGGVVYLPGTYIVTDTITIPRNKPVHLLGDGAERTVIWCTNPNVDILRIKASNTTIENLTIKGPASAGNGRGIVVGQLVEGADQPEVMRRISILGCRVIDTASWCLYFLDFDDTGGVAGQTLTIWAHVERCDFRNNFTEGALRVGRDCNEHLYENCGFESFRSYAVNAIAAGNTTLLACTFEDRHDMFAPPPITPYVSLDGCNNAALISCWFETHQAGHDEEHPFIVVGQTIPCQDVRVSGCRFVRATGNLPRLVHVGSNSKGVLIENPTCALTGDDPLGTRYSGPEADKDIFTVDGCEVVVAGGVVNPTSNSPGVALANSTGTSMVGAGPRISTPRRTSADRDSTTSLARDAKQGDLIFNDTTKGPQFRGFDAWVPFGRLGSADVVGVGTGALVTAAQAEAGMYRISVYAIAGVAPPPGGLTVTLRWWDGTMVTQDPPVRRYQTQEILALTVGTVEPRIGMADVVIYNAGDEITYTLAVTGNSFTTRLRAEAL